MKKIKVWELFVNNAKSIGGGTKGSPDLAIWGGGGAAPELKI